MRQKPYLTSVSFNRRYWYLYTSRKYELISWRFAGLWIIVVSYRRSQADLLPPNNPANRAK